MTSKRLLSIVAAVLVAAGAVAAVPAAAVPATVTTCAGIQPALDAATDDGDVVTLAQGLDCAGHFDLPQAAITLEGAGTGATLRGADDGETNPQILSGFDVGRTTIRNLTFRGGDTEDDGGAIFVNGDSPVLIEDNKFFGNTADGDGGAVFVGSSVPFLDLDRSARASMQTSSDPIVLRDNVFGGTQPGEENDADLGGAVALSSDVPVELTGNAFRSNTAVDEGGGARIALCESTASVTDNRFEANQITGEEGDHSGGGLALVAECNWNIGWSARSAASRVEETTVDVEQAGNVFDGNAIVDGAGDGGGESVLDLQVSSTADQFVKNRIENEAEVSRLVVRGGEAEGAGLSVSGSPGAVALEARNLVAAGNAIANEGEGGGVYVGGKTGGTRARLFDSTIAGNTVGADSEEEAGTGIDGSAQDNLLAYNTIVSGNTGPGPQIGGFDSEEENEPQRIAIASGRDVRASIVCVDGQPHPAGDPAEPNRCVDPGLVGPAAGDVHQTAASPSVNTGSDALIPDGLTEDYEGEARRTGGRVDVGADEFVPATTTGTTTNGSTTTNGTPLGGGAQPSAAPPKAAPPRACTSRRAFRIRLRVPRGKRARSATVFVNGKQVQVVRGKRLRSPVVLRGLPLGTFRVTITIRLRGGKQVSGTRTYHTCVPKRPTKRPPPV